MKHWRSSVLVLAAQRSIFLGKFHSARRGLLRDVGLELRAPESSVVIIVVVAVLGLTTLHCPLREAKLFVWVALTDLPFLSLAGIGLICL